MAGMPTYPKTLTNSETSQTISVRNEVQETAFVNSGKWAG